MAPLSVLILKLFLLRIVLMLVEGSTTGIQGVNFATSPSGVCIIRPTFKSVLLRCRVKSPELGHVGDEVFAKESSASVVEANRNCSFRAGINRGSGGCQLVTIFAGGSRRAYHCRGGHFSGSRKKVRQESGRCSKKDEQRARTHWRQARLGQRRGLR